MDIMGPWLWQQTSALLCTRPLTQPKALKRRGCATGRIWQKWRTTASLSHLTDATRALTKILVLNKDRESWVAANQKNTHHHHHHHPLPAKTQLLFQPLLSDQTGICKYQVAAILREKSGPPGGKKPNPKIKQTTLRRNRISSFPEVYSRYSDPCKTPQFQCQDITLPQSPAALTRIPFLGVSAASAGWEPLRSWGASATGCCTSWAATLPRNLILSNTEMEIKRQLASKKQFPTAW